MYQENTLDHLQSELEQAQPQEILRRAAELYGDKLAVVTSFQITGIVTLHMLKQITDHVEVLTLDTGLLFPETYQLIEDVEARLGVTVQRIKPQLSLSQQANEYGGALWQTDSNTCCHYRKAVPLRDALTGYSAWITGLRRDQSPTRANTPAVSWDERYGLVKFCPFVTWTESMLWTYIHAHDLPYNPLHDRNYPSIGCYTCTVAAQDGMDQRSGRWANSAKTECGIHFPLMQEASHATA